MNDAENESPLPTPNLNFTNRHVRSLLDGSSITSPSSSVPSNIDDNLMDLSGLADPPNPASTTTNDDGDATTGNINVSNPQGNNNPDVNGQPGLRPYETEMVIQFYRDGMEQLKKQNDELSAMVAEINEQRRQQAEQMEAVMAHNKKLLTTITEQSKSVPNVETLTRKIKEELVKDFNTRVEITQQNHQKELQSREDLYLADLKSKDALYEKMVQEALEKSRAENNEALNKQKIEFRRQLEQLNKELDAAKRRPTPAPRSAASINASKTTMAGDASLGTLRQEIFDYVPGTVKTDRGGALQNTTIDWTTLENKPKHVTFATSTPRMHISPDEMEGLAAPLVPQNVQEPVSSSSRTNDSSTLVGLAAEFRKMREPKLQKLKGGNTTSANLFLTSWLADVRAHIRDRELTETEGIQLVREFTEGKARQQVDFYLDTNLAPSLEKLLEHLTSVFTTSEDEATIKSDFYSRKQGSRESEDDFADSLQMLSRKIILVQPGFREEANKALIHQFANGLKDEVTKALAKSLILTHPEKEFIKFRTEVANISGSRSKRPPTKASLCQVDEVELEYQQPAKKAKKDQPSLDAQIQCLLEENRRMNQKIDNLASLHTQNTSEVYSQAVGGAPTRFGQKTMSTAPKFQGSGKPKENTYLGKSEPPKPTKGKNGNLNIAETCNYCKNPGHLLDNCAKLQERIDKGMARPIHASQKQGN